MKTLALALACALALPFAAAESTIVVDAADTHYTPPVSAIASGDSVQWLATDNTHVTVDSRPLGGDSCMYAVSPQHDVSLPVRFDIVDGALVATSELLGSVTCAGAQVTPAGAVLAYHCELHPLMRGTLVVTG